MKPWTFFRLLAVLLVTASPILLSLGAPEAEWTPVGTGIEYREYQLPDPNNVFVARLERDNPAAILESSISDGYLGEGGGRDAVSQQAERYDQALNFWGQAWGNRNDVVVAVNGSFYTPTLGIMGGQIHSGWYARRFTDLGGGSGFAWKVDRNAFIGECVLHRPEKQVVKFARNNASQTFQGVNVERDDNQLILYTPQYSTTTGTDGAGVEVLVEMERPTLILPAPAGAEGVIREIRLGQGATRIPFDHIVLSASGTATPTLVGNIQVGDMITISQEITHYEEGDCQTPLDLGWTKTYASVGGSWHFLKAGEIQEFEDEGANIRNPRTAIAFNDDYIYFIVVDGRDELHSVGMTIEELGIFARDVLSATEAINQDGGGSSTMVVNGEVMNNTYCNNVYCPADAKRTFLPLLARQRSSSMADVPDDPSLSELDAFERRVANGMMMVVVENKLQSNTFGVDIEVSTTLTTEVRLGPGTNYPVVATILPRTEGTVRAHMNQLNGVLAKGSFWWKVAIDGYTGWVREETLTLANPPPPGNFEEDFFPVKFCGELCQDLLALIPFYR